MGYGSSSKGGGGSGNAGGGKKKQGGKKPKSRNFKVKEKKTAATAAAATPAFTVQEPNPEQRARLLAARRNGNQLVTAANDRRRRPVNGTSTRGTVLGGASSASAAGSGSAVVADDEDGMLGDEHQQQQRQNTQQFPTEQEARQAFLATQEAKIEDVRRHREQTIKDKRRAAQQQQDQQFAHKIALARHEWDALAARIDSDRGEGESSLVELKRLLEIVLRNAATKSNPKYKLLSALNNNLWTRLLQFQEVVAILVEGAGFEKRIGVTEKQKETEAARIKMERDRINLQISQALDNASNNPDELASLVAGLDALDIAATRQQPAVWEARDFELYHDGAGGDGLGVKRILALLQGVETW